jgi:hypothetical protein
MQHTSTGRMYIECKFLGEKPRNLDLAMNLQQDN